MYAHNTDDYRLGTKCADFKLIDGPIPCSETVRYITIYVENNLKEAEMLKIDELRVYTEIEIGNKATISPSTLQNPKNGNSIASSVITGLTPMEYKRITKNELQALNDQYVDLTLDAFYSIRAVTLTNNESNQHRV